MSIKEKPQTIKSLDKEMDKCILGCKLCKVLIIFFVYLMCVSFWSNWTLGCIVFGFTLLSFQLIYLSLSGNITHYVIIKIEILRRNKEKRKGGKK